MILPLKIRPILESRKFFDLSDKEYFGSKYKKYISNSSLSLINPEQGGSPQLYYEGLSAHPKVSDSLIFGNAVHTLTLQPNDFILVETVNRPTAKLGYMADYLYPIWKESKTLQLQDFINASDVIDYYKGKMDSKKIDNVVNKCQEYWIAREEWESNNNDIEPIFLDAKSRDRLQNCLQSIKTNKEIQNLLHPSGIILEPETYNELCLLMDVEVTFSDSKSIVLSLKAKLDNFSIDEGIVLNDLKTTGHLIQEFGNSFNKFHYYRQVAMYGWLLWIFADLFGLSNKPKMESNLLLVSTVPKYESGVYKIYDVHIQKGLAEFSKLLKIVAYHERFGYDIESPNL